MVTGPAEPEQVRLSAFVRGRVQGVGFRWWTSARAREAGVDGHVRNRPDGRVEVLAQGSRAACEALLTLLVEQPSSSRRPGRVDGVTHHWLPAVRLPGGFEEG